jgi:hypothetical protein
MDHAYQIKETETKEIKWALIGQQKK